MSYIYILELENNKYYIGKTNTPHLRIENHFQGSGSGWTKIHNPIRVIATIKSHSQFDEDKYTLEYITKYGLDNVRGGSFSRPTLTPEEKQIINRMIQSQKDQCYHCGEEGHFVKECPNRTTDNDTSEWEIIDKSEIEKTESKSKPWWKRVGQMIGNFLDEFDDENTQSNSHRPRKGKCYRCGKYGHWANQCYVNIKRY